MYLIRHHQPVPRALAQAVVTIGNFDGVHLGHQYILKQLKARAQALSKPSGVILFEPQPQEFFSERPPARLCTFRQKYTLLKQQGIDFIMVLRFNKQFARLAAEDFITQILGNQLHISELLTGQDFRFGSGRLGDVALLSHYGERLGFKVQVLPDRVLDDQRISSTQIRSHLAAGELQQARALLGRFFTITGKVVRGDARGRTLNMPTANIALPHKAVPLQGIYVVRVLCDTHYYGGVASLGLRPMFAVPSPLLEVHLLDFNQDIYGKRLNVEFLHKLRDEAHFASIELLQTQMQQDLLAAENYWNEHHDEL